MQGFVVGAAIGFFLYAGYSQDNIWYLTIGWLFLIFFILDIILCNLRD